MKLIFMLLLLPAFAAVSAPQNPPANVEEYRWLYEVLFNETDRVLQPAETFKSFYVHLLDSEQSFPPPELITAANLKAVENVSGQITYVNVIKKMYTYDILKTANGTLLLNIKVHLKDPIGADLRNFIEKIQLAENIWNSARVAADFEYGFKFSIVENEEQAHFSVAVLDSTRGPYDRNWGRNWSPTTIAHELGHMLGLGDEYQTLSGKVDCLQSSLMCLSSAGKPLRQHYYFVLRRLVTPGN